MLVTVSVEKLTQGSFGWAAILRGDNGRATLHWSTEFDSAKQTADKVAQALGVTVVGDLVFAGEADGSAGRVRLITRTEALKAVGLTAAQRFTYSNEQLEKRLTEATTAAVVINAWCPASGFRCAWLDFAPVEELADYAARAQQEWKNSDIAQFLQSKILERQKEKVE